jgi:hypothetical protein
MGFMAMTCRMGKQGKRGKRMGSGADDGERPSVVRSDSLNFRWRESDTWPFSLDDDQSSPLFDESCTHEIIRKPPFKSGCCAKNRAGNSIGSTQTA